MIRNFIEKEKAVFSLFSADAKRLLLVNLIYALAFPFIIIFGTAFVKRITGGDNNFAIIYNWGFFAGLVIGYYINGLLLKNKLISIKNLFVVGILLTVIPLSFLMFFGQGSGYYVIIYGLLVGIGNGIYWSCRNFLSLLVTVNKNRNFFFSLEQFIIIFCNALIPLLFGTFVLGNIEDEEFKINAYKYSSLVVVGTNFIACWAVLKSNFKSPIISRFVYSKFGSLWNRQRLLTFCVGAVESGFMVLMTLLILTVAGDESVLGKIEFYTAIISIISIYIIGRISKPSHRGRIMLTGAIFLIIGGLVLSVTINNKMAFYGSITTSFIGIIIMKVCQVIADPMIHSSYRATLVTSCENAANLENRDSYTYIMDNEYFMNGGRIFGGVVFILITTYISSIVALQFTFIILALIQLISAFIIKKLNDSSLYN
ncbi:MAG TPA: hypothetical protein VFQ86_00690 [Arachidicoccus soli]|nr:hypothetical protein [Arachidicoccus soli]